MTHPDTTALREALEREAAPAPASTGLEPDALWRRGVRRRRLRRTVAGGAVAAMVSGMVGIGYLVVDGAIAADDSSVAGDTGRASGIPAAVEQPSSRTPVIDDGDDLGVLGDLGSLGSPGPTRIAALGEATLTTSSELAPRPVPFQVGTEFDLSWTYAVTTDGTYRFLDLNGSYAGDLSTSALSPDGVAVARMSGPEPYSGEGEPPRCRSQFGPLIVYDTDGRALRLTQLGQRQRRVCDATLQWSGDSDSVTMLLTELDEMPTLYVDPFQVDHSRALRELDAAADIVVGRAPAGVLWTSGDTVRHWEFGEGTREVGPADGARQVVVAPFTAEAAGVADDGLLRTTAWPPSDGSWSTVPGPAVQQIVGWMGDDAVVVQERGADALTVRGLDGSSRPYGADLPSDVVDHASTALAVDLLERPLGAPAAAPSYWYRAPAVRTTAVLGSIGVVVAVLVRVGIGTARRRARQASTPDDWWDGDAR